MPIDRLLIKLRLDRILAMCSELETILQYGQQEYLQSDLYRAASERELHVAIQAMIDIGTHLIAQHHWGAPETYSESMRILGQKKILDADFAARLVQLVKLRNVIIHMYLELDSVRLFTSLSSIVSDLRKFVRVLRDYLSKI